MKGVKKVIKKISEFLNKKKIQYIQRKRILNFKRRIIKSQKEINEMKKNHSIKIVNALKC